MTFYIGERQGVGVMRNKLGAEGVTVDGRGDGAEFSPSPL